MNIIANELIPVYEDNGHQAVNTRELHEFLTVSSKYADWIKNRIEKYGYVENEDYEAVSNFLENGGRSIDYFVSVEVAKELAMVENNDKGRQVRRYFIEVEKRYRGQVKPMTQAEIIAAQAQLMVDIERRQTSIETRVDRMADAIMSVADLTWSVDMNNRINGLCKVHGLNYQTFRSELYVLLESTAHCDLTARKVALQRRMKAAGHKYKDVQAVTKLHVIGDDAKLRAIFDGIVRMQQVKYAGGESA